jgi:hypothetical protein
VAPPSTVVHRPQPINSATEPDLLPGTPSQPLHYMHLPHTAQGYELLASCNFTRFQPANKRPHPHFHLAKRRHCAENPCQNLGSLFLRHFQSLTAVYSPPSATEILVPSINQ